MDLRRRFGATQPSVHRAVAAEPVRGRQATEPGDILPGAGDDAERLDPAIAPVAAEAPGQFRACRSKPLGAPAPRAASPRTSRARGTRPTCRKRRWRRPCARRRARQQPRRREGSGNRRATSMMTPPPQISAFMAGLSSHHSHPAGPQEPPFAGRNGWTPTRAMSACGRARGPGQALRPEMGALPGADRRAERKVAELERWGRRMRRRCARSPGVGPITALSALANPGATSPPGSASRSGCHSTAVDKNRLTAGSRRRGRTAACWWSARCR